MYIASVGICKHGAWMDGTNDVTSLSHEEADSTKNGATGGKQRANYVYLDSSMEVLFSIIFCIYPKKLL